MLMHCTYCNSDAVMPKSGLCLVCGNVIKPGNQNGAQAVEQLNEKDSETVADVVPSEAVENRKRLDIEALEDEFVPAVELAPSLVNAVNTANFIEEQQETAVNASSAVKDDVQVSILPEYAGNALDAVKDTQILDDKTRTVEPAVKNRRVFNEKELDIPKSSIGIKGLDPCYSSIENPGLFVMTCPSFAFAKSILVQTVIHNPYIKTALISFEERNGLFNVSPEISKKLFDIYDMGNLLLSLVCIDSEHLFSRIKQDMEKKAFAAVDLVLIDIKQDIFMSTTDTELAAVLSSWQSWLIQHKKTCIWIVHGDVAPNCVKNKFLNLNNMFNGLANIVSDSPEIKYEVIFWHLYSSIQSNVVLDLLFDEVNYEISVTECNELAV